MDFDAQLLQCSWKSLTALNEFELDQIHTILDS